MTSNISGISETSEDSKFQLIKPSQPPPNITKPTQKIDPQQLAKQKKIFEVQQMRDLYLRSSLGAYDGYELEGRLEISGTSPRPAEQVMQGGNDHKEMSKNIDLVPDAASDKISINNLTDINSPLPGPLLDDIAASPIPSPHMKDIDLTEQHMLKISKYFENLSSSASKISSGRNSFLKTDGNTYSMEHESLRSSIGDLAGARVNFQNDEAIDYNDDITVDGEGSRKVSARLQNHDENPITELNSDLMQYELHHTTAEQEVMLAMDSYLSQPTAVVSGNVMDEMQIGGVEGLIKWSSSLDIDSF